MAPSLRRIQGLWLGYRLSQIARGFSQSGYVLRAYYYTAMIEDLEFSSVRPSIDLA